MTNEPRYRNKVTTKQLPFVVAGYKAEGAEVTTIPEAEGFWTVIAVIPDRTAPSETQRADGTIIRRQALETTAATGTTPTESRHGAASNSVVAIAKEEFDRFHGIDEGDEPLRSRIASYYEAAGGSTHLDPTQNDNAWSAAFISFCIKKSGATPAQFRFSMQHSVFVQAAIANADAGRGVFRGHRITDYAPKLGDIIHHNRDGASLSFDFARDHGDYPSHCAIVVDFEVRNGVRHVVTVGGNEGLRGGTGTVGQKFFALHANGLLNQTAIRPTLICVVENLLARDSTLTAQLPLGPYVVSVRTDLKLRGGPGTNFAEIKSLDNGTHLFVLEFQDMPSGRWALVDLEGDGNKDGFVFATFIEPVRS